MLLRFEYTFKDYVEANTKRTRMARIWNVIWAIVTPITLLGFILVIFDDRQTPSNSKESPLAYLPVMFFFLIMSPWGKRLILFFRWKQQPSLHGVIEYQVSDNFIILTSQTSKSEIQWETFTRFTETKNLFMLYAGRYLFYLIPKRAFQDKSEEAKFRELAERKVKRK